jgi:DNA-directed RNA polymerase specialized sigma24 family protein
MTVVVAAGSPSIVPASRDAVFPANRPDATRGSSNWVRVRLVEGVGVDDWAQGLAGRELIDWLQAVVLRRLGRSSLGSEGIQDIAQDAMVSILEALNTSRAEFARAGNPAAVLERVAERACAEACHRARMQGLGGLPPNGRHWGVRPPQPIGGAKALWIFENLPRPEYLPDPDVEAAAQRADRWITAHVGVMLSEDSVEAVIFVLGRLVDGVSRSSLTRGGHSSLRVEPAMRHLGFEPDAAGVFGVWLLGRTDAEHNAAAVLDAALDGEPADQRCLDRWRRIALRYGFATPTCVGPRRRTA